MSTERYNLSQRSCIYSPETIKTSEQKLVNDDDLTPPPGWDENTPPPELDLKEAELYARAERSTATQSSLEEDSSDREENIAVLAQGLLERGFMPIPIWYDKQQDKLIPKGIHWQEDLFTHSDTPEETWEKIKEKFRTAEGIAIKCGKISNLIVIDVDDPEKFNEFYPIDKLIEEAPYVVQSRTPGHWHFGFAYEEEFSSYKNFTKEAGFELQTNKRTINIHSEHPKIKYDPRRLDELTPMPEELKKKIRDLIAGGKGKSSSIVAGQPGKRPEDYREIAVKTLEILEPYYCKGQRHFFVMYVAGTLRKLGVPEEIAREELKAFCEDRRDEEIPMRLNDIRTTYAKSINEVSGVKGLKDHLGVSEEEISKVFAVAGKQDPKEEPAPFEPEGEIWDSEELANADFPAPEWLIHGVLPEGLSLLSGKPKVGKSWLALGLCREVAKATGRPVFYFGLEDTKGRLKERLLALGGGVKNLYIVPKSPRIGRGGWEFLIKICNDHRPVLIVIDPWVKFRSQPDTRKKHHDPYAFDYESVVRFKQLTEDGISVLIVHHKRKAESVDPLDEVLGTTGITGAVDNILSLKRQRGSKTGLLEVMARDFEERSWGLSFENGKWTFLGEGEEFFIAEEQKKIVEAIRRLGGKASPKQVADALGKNYNTVKTQMLRMLDKGLLKKDAKGIFLSDDRLVSNPSNLCNLSNLCNRSNLEGEPRRYTVKTVIHNPTKETPQNIETSSTKETSPSGDMQISNLCNLCNLSNLSNRCNPEITPPEGAVTLSTDCNLTCNRCNSLSDLGSQACGYNGYNGYTGDVTSPSGSETETSESETPTETETETGSEELKTSEEVRNQAEVVPPAYSEEVFVYMPGEEDKCRLCDKPSVWRVLRWAYEKGEGFGRCMRCGYLWRFNDFVGGVVVSKEDIGRYLD